MELAVDQDRSYRFSATYFGTQLGYFIDTINGTTSNNPCFWFFYYQPPGMKPIFSNLGVSNFVIPDNGGRVIFRYKTFTESSNASFPTPTPAPVPTMRLQVNYQLEFPQQRCPGGSSPPPPVSVEIPVGSVAQRVMELAVDQDRSYRFSATYFGTQLGYFIDTINGTTSNNPCFWFFYYQPPGMKPIFANLGVSNFVIPDNGGRVIFRYETFTESSNASFPTPTPAPVPTMRLQVNYQLEFPQQRCPGGSSPPPPVSVEIPVGSVAQRVMELAVDQDRSYRFSATYFGTQLGYFIDTINGTTSNNPCFWFFYYQPPGMNPVLANLGVSNFVIPDNGGRMIFRYEVSRPIPGHLPTLTPTHDN